MYHDKHKDWSRVSSKIIRMKYDGMKYDVRDFKA